MAIGPAPYDKDYEITDAMFGAFRSSGGTRLFWKLTGCLTCLYAVLLSLFGFQLYITFVEIIMLGASGSALEPEGLYDTIYRYTYLSYAVIFATTVVSGIVRASFYRAYFFGSPEAGMPLRLGLQELRLIGVMLAYSVLYYVIFGLLISFNLWLVTALSETGVMGMGLIALLSLLMTFVAFAVIIAYLTTFNPAGPLTLLRGKMHFLAARHIVKNRFWAVFFSALVAGGLGFGTFYLVLNIAMWIPLSSFIAILFSVVPADQDPNLILDQVKETANGAGFRISMFIAILLVSAALAFYQMLLAGPGAFFTKQWAEAHTETEHSPQLG